MVIIVSVLEFNEFLGLNGFKLMNFLSEKAADQQAFKTQRRDCAGVNCTQKSRQRGAH